MNIMLIEVDYKIKKQTEKYDLSTKLFFPF
jgi:hypothetical protein